MRTTFPVRLALVLFGIVFAYSNRIDINDYYRGKYDLDTVIERLDDIKAAVCDPENIATYPYSDPHVQHLMRILMEAVEVDKAKTVMVRRYLGNEHMKPSEYLLRRDVDLDALIDQVDATIRSYETDLASIAVTPAVRYYVGIVLEGMRRNREWLVDLKQTKDAEVQQTNRRSPLEY